VQDGLTIAGSLIYEWGHADLELVRRNAPPVRSAGRYLTVWSRDASGHWRIVRNLSLPD
jgi:ketosteroid isomerase-like protein